MSLNLFEDITVKSVANQVYQAMKQAILDGRLAPGQQPNEMQLAEQLQVSRTPLREALRRLEVEGFIQRRRGSLYIPSLSRHELFCLYDIRARLEGLAANQAARCISEADLESLNAANERISEVQPGDPDQVLLKGEDFHHQIAIIANNPKNLEFIQNIMGHIARYRVFGTDEGRAAFFEDHLHVLQAFASRDAARAEEAMVQHIIHARDNVLEKLKDRLMEE
ncbi:MAG: GntR family transcriptional regulator [Ktedonobacteraceae bacterium]